MKLNEIKPMNYGEYDLSEGVIPVHLTMTLDKIVADGQVTNIVQHFVMAGLVGLFKDGGPIRWPRDLNSYPTCVGSEIIDAVKSLSSAESVDLARWLLASLQTPASFESNPYACPHPMNTVEWVKWVCRRQD